jgi:hypothetical protein
MCSYNLIWLKRMNEFMGGMVKWYDQALHFAFSIDFKTRNNL